MLALLCFLPNADLWEEVDYLEFQDEAMYSDLLDPDTLIDLRAEGWERHQNVRAFPLYDEDLEYGNVVVVKRLEADEVFRRLQDYLECHEKELEKFEIFHGGVWQARLVYVVGPEPTQTRNASQA